MRQYCKLLTKCQKIKADWGKEIGVYESFRRDLEGKCEICFRAGFCNIAQCDSQKQNERAIIRQIVESYNFTPKKSPYEIPASSVIQLQALQQDYEREMRILERAKNMAYVYGDAGTLKETVNGLLQKYIQPNPQNVAFIPESPLISSINNPIQTKQRITSNKVSSLLKGYINELQEMAKIIESTGNNNQDFHQKKLVIDIVHNLKKQEEHLLRTKTKCRQKQYLIDQAKKRILQMNIPNKQSLMSKFEELSQEVNEYSNFTNDVESEYSAENQALKHLLNDF